MDRYRRQWIAATATAAVLFAAAGHLCAQTSAPAGLAGLEDRSIQSSREDDRIGRDTSGGWADWLRPAAALAVVAGLIFALRYLLRRFGYAGGRTSRHGAIEVLAKTNLFAKHQLVLVRLGRRIILAGVGPQGTSALAEVSDPQEVAELLEAVESRRSDPFGSVLHRKAEAPTRTPTEQNDES